MRTGQTKTPEKLIRKKLVLLASNDSKRTRQGHHQKANTQNINIYNIIHNDHHDIAACPREPKPYVYVTSTFEKTYDTPLRLAKASLKSEHDLMLERELRTYKGEVEAKFNSSVVNQTYSFPRTGPVDSTIPAEPPLDSVETVRRDSSMIKASIYDTYEPEIFHKKKNAPSEDARRPKKASPLPRESSNPPPQNPTTSGKKKAINQDFYKQVQKLLKSGPVKGLAGKSQERPGGEEKEKPQEKSKVSLYSTQRILFDDAARKDFESYVGGTLPAQKLKQYRHNAVKSREAATITKSHQWEEFPAVNVEPKKAHIRTQTMEGVGPKNTALKKIVYLKKLTTGGTRGKSRTSSKTMQLSDYFSELISKRVPNNNGRVANSKSAIRGAVAKTRTRAQLGNTFSLSTLNTTGQGMAKGSQRNTKVMTSTKLGNAKREAELQQRNE